MAGVRKLPVRQCTGCGEKKGKQEMLRIIRTAEDEILLDTTGRKNGRGAYLCRNPECLARARKTKALERSLKTAIPPEIYEGLEKEMRQLAEG